MKIAALLAMLCLLATSGTTRAQASADRVLLVVGSSQGMAEEWPLAYAVHDAERFASVMLDLGDVAADKVIRLRDPSLPEFKRALRRAAELSSASATLVMFYSGHGSATALHVSGEKLALSELHRELATIPAALRLVIIDACRGDFAGKGFKKTKPFEVSLTRTTPHTGTVLLSAAGAGEDALESNSLKSGVFTHHLISALRGAADHDLDGRVSLYEAYDYAYSGTLKTSSRSNDHLQHPTLDVAAAGVGPLVLTRIAPARSLLTLPAVRDEQYIVFEKGSSAAFAESWTRFDRRSLIALPAGQFVVYRRNHQGYSATEVTLPFGGTKDLSDTDFVRTSSLELAHKGGSHELHPNALSFGVGTRFDSVTPTGPAVRLDYARGNTGFGATLGLNFTSRVFDGYDAHVVRRTFDLAPGLEYRMQLGSLTAAIGTGVTVGWIWQQLSTRGGATRGQDSDAAATLGGFAQGTLTLPLRQLFAWQIGGVLNAHFFREDTGTSSQSRRLTSELAVTIMTGPRLVF